MAPLRTMLRGLRYLHSDLRLINGRSDAWRFWRERHFGTRGDTLRVRVPALNSATITLRPGTTDAQVLWYVLSGQEQLPPAILGDVRGILDLGANIGIASALMAVRHPNARILAVEPDPENAGIARTNTAHWSERVEVLEGAAWPTTGSLALIGDDADAFRVAEGSGVTAFAIADLIERAAVDGVVDFVKINVEGAERDLFRETSWTRCVRGINVEVHEPYKPAACALDLSAAGFNVISTKGAWVSGVRS